MPRGEWLFKDERLRISRLVDAPDPSLWIEDLVMATLTQSIEQLLVERPDLVQILDEVGIDAWNGSLTLAQNCQRHGIDPEIVLDRLERTDQDSLRGPSDFSQLTLTELCTHVLNVHHAGLKRMLPSVGQLLFRVAEGEAERHPELGRALELFSVFAGELKLHLAKEEEVLFPLIVEFEQTNCPCGDITTLIEQLESEDIRISQILGEMRQLTRDFAPPSGACETYRAVLTLLQDVERALFDCAGVENNVLFPRACQLFGVSV